MILRDFLRLYVSAALLGGLAFWPAACASNDFASKAGRGRAGVHNGSELRGTEEHPEARAPKALSQPVNTASHTAGKPAATVGTSGSVRSGSAFKHQAWGEGSGPSAQGDLTDTQVPDDGQRIRPRTGSANAANCVTPRRADSRGDGGQQVFEGGAARRDALMTLTEKPTGSETGPSGLRSHRPAARGVRSYELELGQAGIKAGRHLRTLATNAAHLCGVEPALFHALITRESSWRPFVVSSSGAVGLGQIKPSTLRDIDPTLNAWEPWDNLLGSACYLRQQFDRFGTWRKALKAYHAGPNRKTTTAATHAYADDVMGSAQ